MFKRQFSEIVNCTTYNTDNCKAQQEVSKQMCVKPINVLEPVIILIDDNIMASPGAVRVLGERVARTERASNPICCTIGYIRRVKPAKPL